MTLLSFQLPRRPLFGLFLRFSSPLDTPAAASFGNLGTQSQRAGRSCSVKDVGATHVFHVAKSRLSLILR